MKPRDNSVPGAYRILLLSAQDVSLLRGCAALEEICIPDGWHYCSFVTEAEKPGGYVLAAVRDGQVLGFLTASAVADTADLTNLAVAPAFRQQGIASALLGALLERLRISGVRELFLEVRASNAAAIACYQKHGFCQAGIRKRFYQHPPEDAILMQCRLSFSAF